MSLLRRVVVILVLIWAGIFLTLLNLKDRKVNEESFTTRSANVIYAECNDTRSFLGVDVQLRYAGETSVESETLQILENIDCDDRLLNYLKVQGVTMTTYEHWQIEIITGDIALISRSNGLSRASDFGSVRGFLIVLGLIATLYSFIYVIKKSKNGESGSG